MDVSKFTVEQLKAILNRKDPPDEAFLRAIATDKRVSVRSLYQVYEKRLKAVELEQERLKALFYYEDQLCQKGVANICGIDEAGRGPLAGPVVAAAVILPKEAFLEGLNDSKKVTKAKREVLFGQIKRVCKDYSVGVANVSEIERLNIYWASLLAMKRAVERLHIDPQHILVDGFRVPGIRIEQTPIIGGDGKSASIAAASIIAKVTRDRIMSSLHRKFPQYGFDHNSGYGTNYHLEALSVYGPCPVHRLGFEPVKLILK